MINEEESESKRRELLEEIQHLLIVPINKKKGLYKIFNVDMVEAAKRKRVSLRNKTRKGKKY